MSNNKMKEIMGWMKHKKLDLIKNEEELENYIESKKDWAYIFSLIVACSTLILFTIVTSTLNFKGLVVLFSGLSVSSLISAYIYCKLKKIGGSRIMKMRNVINDNKNEIVTFIEKNHHEIIRLLEKEMQFNTIDQLSKFNSIVALIHEKKWLEVSNMIESLYYYIPKIDKEPCLEKELNIKEMQMNYQL